MANVHLCCERVEPPFRVADLQMNMSRSPTFHWPIFSGDDAEYLGVAISICGDLAAERPRLEVIVAVGIRLPPVERRVRDRVALRVLDVEHEQERAKLCRR